MTPLSRAYVSPLKLRALEIGVMGRSRSLEIVPFNTSYTTYYQSYIVSEIQRDTGRKSRFLPRDAYAYRGLCGRKMSVCHTPVFCLNGYTILKFFFTIGQPHHSSFPHQTGWQYSNENPLAGTSNARGMKKITIFDQYISLYLANDARQSHSYYGRRIGNGTIGKLSYGTIFNDLERPLPPVSRSHHSLTLNISETVGDADIVSMEY